MNTPDLSKEENAIINYLQNVGEATTKDVADNVNEIPKNRAQTEIYLWKLFMKDEVYIAKKGRIKLWRPNHIVIRSKSKPIGLVKLPEYNEYNKNIRNLWIGLYSSKKYGDYIYIQETRWVEGEGWVSKGGFVLSIDMVLEFIISILKISLKSGQFREKAKKTIDAIKSFILNVYLEKDLLP